MITIEKTNISNKVFDMLLMEIDKGTWKLGEKILSENNLSQMLGVSRVSVRSAIDKLVALGILEKYHGKGTFVKNAPEEVFMNSLISSVVLDNTNITYLLDYKRVIEKWTIELVLKNITDEDFNKLEEILGKLSESKNDYESFETWDIEFHRSLAVISDNPIILQLDNYIRKIVGLKARDLINVLGPDMILFYHEKLFAAIKNMDRNEADRIIDEHIKLNIERILAYMKK